jgi:hypothetical protein
MRAKLTSGVRARTNGDSCFDESLGGHPRSGQWWSPQNRQIESKSGQSSYSAANGGATTESAIPSQRWARTVSGARKRIGTLIGEFNLIALKLKLSDRIKMSNVGRYSTHLRHATGVCTACSGHSPNQIKRPVLSKSPTILPLSSASADVTIHSNLFTRQSPLYFLAKDSQSRQAECGSPLRSSG